MSKLKYKVQELLDEGKGISDIVRELELPESDVLRICEHLATEQESESTEVALSTEHACVAIDDTGRIVYTSPNEQRAMDRFAVPNADPLEQELKISAGYALLEIQRRLSSKRLNTSELSDLTRSISALQTAFVNNAGLSVNIANVSGEGSMIDAFRSKLRN